TSSAMPLCAVPSRAEPTHDTLMLSRGKRDNDLILPINSSLSVTLHQDQVGVGSRSGVVGAPQPRVGADPGAQGNPLGGCGGSGGFTSRCPCVPPPGQWGEEAGGQHGGDADQRGHQPLAEGTGQRA
uniref:Uncharacterized protein n=1 Tax=Buteo japonicus TaxID=224669 RepID=A0A8B9Z6S6_9AVES